MLRNFGYIKDGLLAGSAMPGVWASLAEDLADAREQGITAVVSLTEEKLTPAVVQEAGLRYLHIPVEDFQPPTQNQIEKFVRFVDEERERGGSVLVHCIAGRGRTGTMLAAYLVKEGLPAIEAVEEVRRLRPGSIETQSQINAVKRFEKTIRKRG